MIDINELRRLAEAANNSLDGMRPFSEAADADAVLELLDRLEAAERDAARYRFVRTADSIRISTKSARDPVAYDEAIDAAMLAAGTQAADK